MSAPIKRMIDSAVSCGKCGTSGVGNCDCYEHCSCGYWAEKGKPCRNPTTTRCSTKVKYGSNARADALAGEQPAPPEETK